MGGVGGVGKGPKIENRFGKIEHFIVNNHGGEQTMNPLERAHIIDWLSPINMFLRQADIFGTWQPGTGRWLLEHDSFGKWKSGTGGILWCKGMPGAGKTVLTSLITNVLRAEAECQNIGVAVLYLNHKETEYSTSNLVFLWPWPQAKKPWLYGSALAFSGFGSMWLWPGLGFSKAKAKASLESLPKAMA
ncbi:hypothetical protein B0H14DRAFT_1534396 [Mycena olivaceomarginata]|nr:hypothetical protein B0H14DRAFT_1534396 [Mycena olivaceomarginata]